MPEGKHAFCCFFRSAGNLLKTLYTEFDSNYHDQEAVKTSKYTDGIARIKDTHYRELLFQSVDARCANRFFSLLFLYCSVQLEL